MLWRQYEQNKPKYTQYISYTQHLKSQSYGTTESIISFVPKLNKKFQYAIISQIKVRIADTVKYLNTSIPEGACYFSKVTAWLLS